jgi:hypothetical protein
VTVAISKAIRAALAAEGYGKADVSVYNKGYSMGSTVYVTIKRAEIPLDAVEEIAKAHERISRDDATGEILGGGNSFVDVRYGDGVLDAAAAIIAKQIDAGRRRFGAFTLEPGRDQWSMTIWHRNDHGESRPGLNVDANDPSEGLARVLASAGALGVLEQTDDECPECGQFDAHEGLCAGPEEPSRFAHPRPLGIDEMHEATSSPEARSEAQVDAAADGILGSIGRWLPGAQKAADAMALGERAHAVAAEMFGAEATTTERLERRVVRAAERWQAAFPCPPSANEARLHALWMAVERLVAHEEGRAPCIEGDQTPR